MSSDLNFTGVVHGNRIELDHAPGLSDGQRVIVNVQPLPAQKPGDGIRASAGAWAGADDQEFAQWLDDVYKSRRSNHVSEEP